MAARVSRVALQVLYLEQLVGRTPNTLLEQLGLFEVRAAGDVAAPHRKTLDILGTVSAVDDPVRRETQLRFAGDRVLEIALAGTVHNLHAVGWEDASIVVATCAADVTLTGLEYFECRQPVKLLHNLGPGTLTLPPEHAGSQRDNRLVTELALAAGGIAFAVRDLHISRWRLTAGVVAEGGGEVDGEYYTTGDGEKTVLGF